MAIDPRGPEAGAAQPQSQAAGPAGPDEERRERGDVLAVVMRWLARATVAGAVISVLVHVVIGLIAGLVTVRYPSPDAGGLTAGSEVEFAVMTESELAAVLAQAEQSPDPIVPESDAALDPATIELSEVSPSSSDALTDATLEVEIDAGAGDVGGGSGEGLVTGAGGGGASFFGLEAQGSRFAYIVDRSSSMRGAKMARTRNELSQSISGLMENGEFLVVFYSDDPEALGGRPRWQDASERSKEEARRLIQAVVPQGGTKPLPAFELVFGRRVKPDAIYFMTDGRFGDDVPGRIEALNRRYDIPIHCILFGEPSASSMLTEDVRQMMQRIANASGGRFRHVETAP